MSYSGSVHIDNVYPVSYKLGTADATAPYLAMAFDTTKDNTVKQAVATNEAIFAGISQDIVPTKVGEAIAVKPFGFTLATAGGNVTRGALLKIGTGGKLVVASASDKAIARCLTDANADEYIEVQLFGGYVVV